MGLKKVKYLLLYLSLLLCSRSCVEPFYPNTEEEVPIVVSFLIRYSPENPEQTQSLDLFYARAKGEKPSRPIEDASITLYGGNSYRFVHKEGSRWESEVPVIIHEQQTFVLEIEVPGHPKISARTSIPYGFRLLDGTYLPGQVVIDENTLGSDGKKVVRPHKLWIFAHKDDTHNESYPYLVTSNSYVDDFNVTSLRYSDIEYPFQDNEDNLFWQIKRSRQKNLPDAPLHEGGFVRIDLPEYYDNCLEIEARHELFLDSSMEFFVECLPLNPQEESNLEESHLCIMGVSDEYDRFLREAFTHWGKINHDLASVYNYDNIYTNINGGVGVFGACCIARMKMYHNYDKKEKDE